jgi:hypothetical protein
VGNWGAGDGFILPKSRKTMRIRNFFSVKYDIFDIDMGWYNRTYYGGLCGRRQAARQTAFAENSNSKEGGALHWNAEDGRDPMR